MGGTGVRVTRIGGYAARGSTPGGLPHRPPVRGPLPHVADQVHRAVGVLRVAAHRRGGHPPVLDGVAVGEGPLPGVGQVPTVGAALVAPGVVGVPASPAGGELVLGLGRQPHTRPACVGLRVLQADLRDRVLGPVPHRVRARSFGAAPGRTRHPGPPARGVVQRHRPRGPGEDQRPGDQDVGVDPGIVLRVGRPLRDRHVAALLDEPRELRHGDRRAIEQEAGHPRPADRAFLRVEALRPHPELGAGDEDRPRRGLRHRGSRAQVPSSGSMSVPGWCCALDGPPGAPAPPDPTASVS